MMYADKGGEFQSADFIRFCDLLQINLIFSESPYKISMVERSQRTLLNIMYRQLHYNNTKRYLDSLEDIVHTHNSRVHRVIGISLNSAYQSRNKSTVLYNLEQYYRKALSKRKTRNIR